MSGPRSLPLNPNKSRNDWETPPWLFDALHAEFAFDVDAASSHENAKLERHWTEEEDGLRQSWRGLRVFCNPPYGMCTGAWVRKAHAETLKNGCPLAVQVVPANTETSWWHLHAMAGCTEIRFIQRRIHFLLGGRRVRNCRPVFSSAVLIFHLGARVGPLIASSLVAPDPKTLQHGRPIPQGLLFPKAESLALGSGTGSD